MQIDGSKIAQIAHAKLKLAVDEAEKVEPYGHTAESLKIVRREIAAAHELIALLAGQHDPA